MTGIGLPSLAWFPCACKEYVGLCAAMELAEPEPLSDALGVGTNVLTKKLPAIETPAAATPPHTAP